MGALLALLLAGAASAQWAGPLTPGLRLPSLAVLDDAGRTRDLRELARGTPTILLPIFTSCGGTCPRTAEALKSALKGRAEGFHVVALSFDPEDSPADLRAFRKAHGLPSSWRLARGSDAGQTRACLDLFGFRVMSASGGFIHPDAAFVLSPGGVWVGSFYGSVFEPAALDAASRRAREADAPTLASRLRETEAWLPFAMLLLLAFVGFAVKIGRGV